MSEQNPVEIMRTFTAANPPTLDVAVLAALQEINAAEKSGNKCTRLDFSGLGRLLCVGSGNGKCTAEILGRHNDSTVADESNLAEKLRRAKYDAAIIISASGEKDAPGIIERIKRLNIPTHLLTCRQNSTAASLAEKVTTFPLGREPISYNVMTYLSMILASTGENPQEILNELDELLLNWDKKEYSNIFGQRPGFTFILPARFATLIQMLQIKFVELFQHHISYFGCTGAFAARHVTSLVQEPRAVYVNLDPEFDMNRLHLKCDILNLSLPLSADWGMAMAICYYLVGLIQRNNQPWFAQRVIGYCQEWNTKPIAE